MFTFINYNPCFVFILINQPLIFSFNASPLLIIKYFFYILITLNQKLNSFNKSSSFVLDSTPDKIALLLLILLLLL